MLRQITIQVFYCFLFFATFHPALADTDIPEPLQKWENWVLEGHPDVNCPWLHNELSRACIWPTQLTIDANASGATFEQSVEVFGARWISLPGEDDIWPQSVFSGSKSLSIRRSNGLPEVYVPDGQHTLRGELKWSEIPRTLTIPPHTGLLTLRVNNKVVESPDIEKGNQLWLAQTSTTAKSSDQDRANVRVFRRISDTIPLQITTLLQLDISGKERELQLGQLLIDDFIPLSFDSPLPARLEADGSVRLQGKPGSWTITLIARSKESLTNLGYKATHDLWPAQEIWVFNAERHLRTVQIEGAPTVDPQQTQLPPEWQNLPAYLMTPESRLQLNELHRGDPNPSSNQLTLSKEIWLDFNGAGYTVEDDIQGTMNQGWRLEATEPYILGSATLNYEPQLVTRLAANGRSGVEVRERAIQFTASSRLPQVRELPVSGWDQDFNNVTTVLHMAPGWSLLTASGADQVQGSWIAKWRLWDIFLVLIIAVTLGRICGISVSLLALAVLVLTYHRSGAPLFIWLNIAAALALLPVVSNKFKQVLFYYTAASFLLLGLMLLPYSVDQARQAVYPQQEFPYKHIQHATLAADSYEAEVMSPEPSMVRSLAAPMDASYEEAGSVGERVYKSAPTKQRLSQEYDPGQQVQTGPGVPQWQWHKIRLHWSGPVKPEEITRLYLLPPFINRIGSLLALLLPLVLGGLLLQKLYQGSGRQSFNAMRKSMTAIPMLVIALGLFPSPDANADILVNAEILKELEARLTKAPQCLPDCASIESVNLQADGNNLTLELVVHTADFIAMPLPARHGQWWPNKVTANDQRALLTHNHQGQLFIALEQGRHTLNIQGSLMNRDSVNLDFGLPIHNVNIHTKDWIVGGLPQARQLSDSLQLQRAQQTSAGDNAERLLPDPVPTFVSVTRTLQLGLEWRIETRVTRLAPAQGVINLEIPLLSGESPISGQPTQQGKMQVQLGSRDYEFIWQSVLTPVSPLTLSAAKDVPWIEIWVIDTAPIWHVDTQGIPSVQLNQDQNLPLWQPWPGESLTLTVTRPEAVAGNYVTIDSVNLEHELGRRANSSSLDLTVRANQGGYYDFSLPSNAKLSRITIDGMEQTLSNVDGKLKIPLHPGEQRIHIKWQGHDGVQIKSTTPGLDLGMPSSNQSLAIRLPADRWPLLVGGPSMGPSVLLWGLLAVVIILAVGLARSGLTPLKTYQWVLLSLGISTVTLYSLALVALWLVALQVRGRLTTLPKENSFRALQVGLFCLSLITLLVLIGSIPYGLLSSPDMHIAGNGSTANNLLWYQDQSDNALASAWVISLPMWVYRVAMLIWSLWLAFALINWIRWSWQQLSHLALWSLPKPTEPPAP